MLRRRGGTRPQLPRRAFQQQPAPQCDRRLPGGGGEQTVEMVTGEMRPLRQGLAVRAGLVQRVEHEIY